MADSKKLDELRQAARQMATMWESMVEAGMPEAVATQVIVGMVTGSSKDTASSLEKLMKMSVDH